jgi:hypothetical protein
MLKHQISIKVKVYSILIYRGWAFLFFIMKIFVKSLIKYVIIVYNDNMRTGVHTLRVSVIKISKWVQAITLDI